MHKFAKNSNSIVAMIKCFDIVENNIFLLIDDAKVMHPNDNDEEGLAFLMLALDTLIFKVRPN